MNHPTCSAEGIETHAGGPGSAVFFCVFHLIAGVAVALLAFGALAIFSPIFG
ncbi:MAG: hypothetical protein ABL889_16260 [Terricaulis sp.]